MALLTHLWHGAGPGGALNGVAVGGQGLQDGLKLVVFEGGAHPVRPLAQGRVGETRLRSGRGSRTGVVLGARTNPACSLAVLRCSAAWCCWR